MSETTEQKQPELINKVDVMRIVKQAFKEQFDTLQYRPQAEQKLIGDNLNVIEVYIKEQVKAL